MPSLINKAIEKSLVKGTKSSAYYIEHFSNNCCKNKPDNIKKEINLFSKLERATSNNKDLKPLYFRAVDLGCTLKKNESTHKLSPQSTIYNAKGYEIAKRPNGKYYLKAKDDVHAIQNDQTKTMITEWNIKRSIEKQKTIRKKYQEKEVKINKDSNGNIVGLRFIDFKMNECP